jgi:hypothetical protein
MTSVYSHLDSVGTRVCCEGGTSVANVGDYKGGYPLGGVQKAEPPCNLGMLGLTHMTDNIIWC